MMTNRRCFLNLAVCAVFFFCVAEGGSSCFAGEGVVKYSARVSDVPPLGGFMSPTRDLIVEDLETLADWNAKLLRFQITRNWLAVGTERDLVEYDAWFDSRLDNLEKMLPVAHRLGIRIMLDFHTPPGGRVENNIMRMFDEEIYADHFIVVWKRIAERFKDNEYKDVIWAYDLLNEPIQSQKASERGAGDALLLRAARAIREIDPDMPICYSPFGGGAPAGFVNLKPLPVDNVIYQAHMYAPFPYTHQSVFPELVPKGGGFIEYPGAIEGDFWGKSRIRKELQPVRDFQKRYGARMYIGEFSAIAWAPNADVYFMDCIDVFEEYGWDWSYHSFREWDGFSLEHEGVPPGSFLPSKDNPRKKAILNALRQK